MYFLGRRAVMMISVWPRPAKEQRPDVESLEICALGSRMQKMKQMKQLENVNSNSQSHELGESSNKVQTRIMNSWKVLFLYMTLES